MPIGRKNLRTSFIDSVNFSNRDSCVSSIFINYTCWWRSVQPARDFISLDKKCGAQWGELGRASSLAFEMSCWAIFNKVCIINLWHEHINIFIVCRTISISECFCILIVEAVRSVWPKSERAGRERRRRKRRIFVDHQERYNFEALFLIICVFLIDSSQSCAARVKSE